MVKLLLRDVSHKFLAGLVQKLDFPPISAAAILEKRKYLEMLKGCDLAPS